MHDNPPKQYDGCDDLYSKNYLTIRDWLIPCKLNRQSLLSLHMTKSYVRTATRTTLKVEANLTQILSFKPIFTQNFNHFFKKNYANNGGHFKIVSIKIKN